MSIKRLISRMFNDKERAAKEVKLQQDFDNLLDKYEEAMSDNLTLTVHLELAEERAREFKEENEALKAHVDELKEAWSSVDSDEPSMQPLVKINGVPHFRENSLVKHLFDKSVSAGNISNLQALIRLCVFTWEKEQLLQLLGVSVSSYGKVMAVSTESKKAVRARVKMMKEGL